jgi:hypothetical protein
VIRYPESIKKRFTPAHPKFAVNSVTGKWNNTTNKTAHPLTPSIAGLTLGVLVILLLYMEYM